MKTLIKTSLDEICPYVRKAGTQNKDSWKNRFRRIYDHEFFYCSKGNAYITIEDRQHSIVPGTLILVKPDTPHTLWMDENNPADLYWVHFDFFYRNDVYALENLVVNKHSILYNPTLPNQHYIRPEPVLENGFVFPEFLQIDEYIQCEEIFKKTVNTFKTQRPCWQLECKILLLQLLKMIIIQKNHQNDIKSINLSSVTDTIIAYIQRNYYRKLSLRELSNTVNLSPDYLGKIFKKDMGITISKYINHLKIAKAKKLLLSSDLSIGNIAEMVGFSDIYYFSKTMKQYEGISPSGFRKHKVKNLSNKI